MWCALIQTRTVQIGEDGKSIDVVADLLEGHVEAGMQVDIPLNRSTSVSLPIHEVRELDSNRVVLVLEGGNDEDETYFIIGLNPANEVLVVSSTTP